MAMSLLKGSSGIVWNSGERTPGLSALSQSQGGWDRHGETGHRGKPTAPWCSANCVWATSRARGVRGVCEPWIGKGDGGPSSVEKDRPRPTPRCGVSGDDSPVAVLSLVPGVDGCLAIPDPFLGVVFEIASRPTARSLSL